MRAATFSYLMGFAFLGSGCGTFSSLFEPAAVIPTRPMQRVLPVPRLVAPSEAVGSCVRYAPDGTFILEACPAALAGIATNAADYKAAQGEHESGTFVVDPRQPPPGYGGKGGYWHVREAHITRVLTSALGGGKLGSLQLDRVDALCRDIGRSGDRVIVDRAYAGCAVIADGVADAPKTSDDASDQLASQHRRLGSPKNFRIDDGKVAEAACEGEETTILVGVVTLASVCNEIVRDLVLTRASKEAAAAMTELSKTLRELETKEYALAAIDAHDRLARDKAAPILAAHQALEAQVQVLRQAYDDAARLVRSYRGDPYGLAAARGEEGEPETAPIAKH